MNDPHFTRAAAARPMGRKRGEPDRRILARMAVLVRNGTHTPEQAVRHFGMGKGAEKALNRLLEEEPVAPRSNVLDAPEASQDSPRRNDADRP